MSSVTHCAECSVALEPAHGGRCLQCGAETVVCDDCGIEMDYTDSEVCAACGSRCCSVCAHWPYECDDCGEEICDESCGSHGAGVCGDVEDET